VLSDTAIQIGHAASERGENANAAPISPAKSPTAAKSPGSPKVSRSAFTNDAARMSPARAFGTLDQGSHHRGKTITEAMTAITAIASTRRAKVRCRREMAIRSSAGAATRKSCGLISITPAKIAAAASRRAVRRTDRKERAPIRKKVHCPE